MLWKKQIMTGISGLILTHCNNKNLNFQLKNSVLFQKEIHD